MRRKAVLPAMATATVLLLSSCGASPTAASGGGGDSAAAAKTAAATYDRINGMSGQERHDALVEQAKNEGKLSIYTSNTDIDDLVSGFKNEYHLDVTVYRANSETVLQRELQEQKAGYFGNDLVETNAGELNVMNSQHMLAPYEGELRDKVRKEGQADGWTASRFNVFVVGWNTDRVKPGQEPRSFEDLADPKWKGQVSMEVGDVDWFAAMYEYYRGKGKTDAEVRDLFDHIAANSKVAKGHTTQGELLSAGQFAITVSSYSHTIDKAAHKGAPVTWHPSEGQPVQPIVVRPNGMGLMSTARHPAAAMLFMDYALTDGQKAIHDAYRIGSVPTEHDPLAGLEVVAPPEKDLLDNPKKWDDLYADIVQSGQEIK